jgi:predicted metal-dependent HD superfamily phosphohydrolase
MPSHRILLELTRRYCEPHRHYHGLAHIAWLFETARGLPLTEEQVLAIWFHDAVYEIPSQHNEEASARLAGELLRNDGYPDDRIELVQRMVLDTKEHYPSIEPSRIVVDLDLAPLAVSWDEFRANSEKIRREYAAIPEAELANGRRRVLEEFLARDAIYTTSWGERWEEAARRNIARALGG